MINVHEISAVKAWELAVRPDQAIHLPHLGLMINAYYRPGQSGGEADVSPERAAIRKGIREAVGPLMELEAATAKEKHPTTE
jgi:hypothetical protein